MAVGEVKEPTKQPRPVMAMPGSEAKVEALAKRYDRGEFLFHDQDAGMPALDSRTRSVVNIEGLD